jgi:hypothetical protein
VIDSRASSAFALPSWGFRRAEAPVLVLLVRRPCRMMSSSAYSMLTNERTLTSVMGLVHGYAIPSLLMNGLKALVARVLVMRIGDGLMVEQWGCHSWVTESGSWNGILPKRGRPERPHGARGEPWQVETWWKRLGFVVPGPFLTEAVEA